MVSLLSIWLSWWDILSINLMKKNMLLSVLDFCGFFERWSAWVGGGAEGDWELEQAPCSGPSHIPGSVSEPERTTCAERLWRLATEPPRCPPKPCFYMFYMFYFLLQKKYVCITKIQNSLYKKDKVSYKPNALRNIAGLLDALVCLKNGWKQDGGKQPRGKLGLCGLCTAPLWAFVGCGSPLFHWQLNSLCFSVHKRTDSVCSVVIHPLIKKCKHSDSKTG